MSDEHSDRTRRCPDCGHANTLGADACADCGAPLAHSDVVSRGATFNDPDDMSFPEEREWTREERGTARADVPPPMRDVATHLRPNVVRADAPPPVRYAGFLRRAAAFVVDLVVLTAFTIPLAVAGLLAVRAAVLLADLPRQLSDDEAVATLVSIGSSVMFVVYFAVLHTGTGQTIGKALLGIGVRSIDLRSIGIVRSVIRIGGYVASAGVFGLGFLMIALTPRKRAWHDYVAGTCVVRVTPTEA